jgi:hypothetical protein
MIVFLQIGALVVVLVLFAWSIGKVVETEVEDEEVDYEDTDWWEEVW